MKIYFAGPDVFRPDAWAWADVLRGLCREVGHEPLIPIDSEADTAVAIYASNIAMLREADAVIANLDPFRGAEPDSGTCFEVGYALALGKPVLGYVSQSGLAAERVAAWQGRPVEREGDSMFDGNGARVENFGLPMNLMLAVPLEIVVGDVSDALARLLVVAN